MSLCRDENGERKKELKISEPGRKAKPTERGDGVGGGEPPPTIGASAICPLKLRILVDLKM